LAACHAALGITLAFVVLILHVNGALNVMETSTAEAIAAALEQKNAVIPAGGMRQEGENAEQNVT
tara:strand:+ start:237 stop:431 length:195 start_codon:yes stop_codon:yes gene_type:complete